MTNSILARCREGPKNRRSLSSWNNGRSDPLHWYTVVSSTLPLKEVLWIRREPSCGVGDGEQHFGIREPLPWCAFISLARYIYIVAGESTYCARWVANIPVRARVPSIRLLSKDDDVSRSLHTTAAAAAARLAGPPYHGSGPLSPSNGRGETWWPAVFPACQLCYGVRRPARTPETCPQACI